MATVFCCSLIASFSADEQIFHLCGDSLMQKQLCLKYINTHQKSVNQGQSHAVVYPLCGACEKKLSVEATRVLCVSPGWNRDQSARSSPHVVIQQQRKGCWMWMEWWSGKRNQWCEGNTRQKKIACAICKWDGTLLNSWQSHWNGLGKEGGKTHHPLFLYYFCVKRKTHVL